MKKSRIIGISISLGLIFLIPYMWHLFWNFYTPEIMSYIGQYFTGTIGIILTFMFAVMAYITYRHQVNAVEKQNFVNVFYKLLDLYRENTISMNIADRYEPEFDPNYVNKESLKGRNVFGELYEKLKSQYDVERSMHEKSKSKGKKEFKDEVKSTEFEVIQNSYLKFDGEYQQYIGYYFRNLYNIIYLADQQTILKENEKEFYINMLRGQLSSYELLLLFYNCLSIRGYKNFKPLIEKYTFFKHLYLVEDKLINKSHKDYYDNNAFIENTITKTRK